MSRPLLPQGVRRALIVAPHPDDETIGCGGLILRLLRHGARVDILVVTDGAASHRHSASFPPRRLAAVRARETRAACARLGVPPHRLRMLGLPDGGMTGLTAAQSGLLRRAVARHARADLLCLPDPGDAHPDHRGTAQICRVAPGRATRLAYLVWPRAGHAPRRTHHLVLGADRRRKARALACHRTQLGLIRDDPGGFTIDAATHRRFIGPVERYRRIGR